MPSDKQLLKLRTHRSIARRQLLQSGGVVAGSAMAAGVAFPARALAAGVPAEHVPAWLDLLSRAIPASLEDYAPVALSGQRSPRCGPRSGGSFPPTSWVPAPTRRASTSSSTAVWPAPTPPLCRCTRRGWPRWTPARRAVASPPLTAERQDELLTQVEAASSPMPRRVSSPSLLEHTRQGMFGDPIYGGNKDFAGWDLIGYPGIKLVWTEEEQAIDAVVEPQHISVEQFGGTGW